ncbi:TraR/DksA C4-type zinc finger protein [Burkholderia perseverans]|uniref:TraR/DksA C4-type zinc finger protein n=1 Tax=Burkholderia perseverans TaxID=2615214 RepID=UPI001FEF98EE|nr:TraR/DksA C4-type zinc finger protein [Burkholderia perseverans]
MDDFDKATAVEEMLREIAINAATQRPGTDRESAEFCLDDACGEPIPEARRLAVPGCQFCIECQTRRETTRRTACK